MTLYIRILSAQNFLSSKGKIYIDGSQAGALVTSYKSKNPSWDHKFDIHCSGDDQLEFKICGVAENLKDQPVIAIAKFHSPSIIKTHGDKLSMQEPYQYHIDAYTSDEKEAGTIKMQLTYDKSQKYMGELNGLVRQEKEPTSYYPLYRGKCKTTNLFSFLDGKADGQEDEFKFVESIYRDQ